MGKDVLELCVRTSHEGGDGARGDESRREGVAHPAEVKGRTTGFIDVSFIPSSFSKAIYSKRTRAHPPGPVSTPYIITSLTRASVKE